MVPTTRTRLRFLGKQMSEVQDKVISDRLLNAKAYSTNEYDDDGKPYVATYVRYQTPLNINHRVLLLHLKNEIEAILEECKDDGY